MSCGPLRYVAQTAPAVRAARANEAERCEALVTLAFGGDPVARWVWPDPLQYRSAFPPFVGALAGRAFERGSAHVLAGNEGAALWLAPGVEPDERALLGVVERTVPAERLGGALELVERMGPAHPDEPHWYLPFIAVDPAHQRKGLGSVLLRHALAICDREGRLAYLEATSAANRALYERHGFEAVGEIRVGSSPPLTPMLREPR